MNRFFWVSSALVLMAAASLARAQASAARNWLGPGMDPSRGKISIDLTVSDAAGHPVSGLTSKDVTLLDNGQPAKLVTFEPHSGDGDASDPPVSVVLVIDQPDLSHDHAAEAFDDARTYLLRHSGRLPRETTVYLITSDTLYATTASTDGNFLAAQLSRRTYLRRVWPVPEPTPSPALHPGQIDVSPSTPPQQSVPLEVGMPIAMRALGAITIEQRRKQGRKLLFWIGPGWRVDHHRPKQFFETIVEFSTRMREARIEMSMATRWVERPGDEHMAILGANVPKEYLAGANAPADALWGNLGPQVLAQHTGGGMLTGLIVANTTGSGAGDIPGLIEKHIRQAGPYYRLTFDPPPTGIVDEYRGLSVQVDRPHTMAHTTAGYYNEPVYDDDRMPYFKRLSVAQIEQILKRGGGDRELAEELASCGSSERVSSIRLARWLAAARGKRTRQALTVLADHSAFLDPPADDLLPQPAPTAADQQKILKRAADYLSSELPRLPNFYATRVTTQYGEPLPKEGQTWKIAQRDRRLLLERTTRARVYFEDHKEVVDHEAVMANDSPLEERLNTSGTFGPVLVLAMKRASQPGSTIYWSRWEKGAAGPVAVYRFDIAPDLHGFQIGFCCLPLDSGLTPFQRDASFNGEVSIDPSTGHILRLMIHAKLEPRLPLRDSGIVVEYGPVSMGGVTWFCPLHSISMSRQRRLWETREWGLSFRHYGPFKTILNDARFENYHVFLSDSHILPDYIPVPQN